MRKVKVVSKKYNGALREEYETYLYAETDETITLFSPPDLLEQVQIACQEVEAGLANQTYPFDHERQVELCNQIKANR